MDMWPLIDSIGKKFFDSYRDFKHIFLFIYLSFRSALKLNINTFRPIAFNTISQIYFSGHMALPLISFIALAAGSIIVIQSMAQLSILGSQEMMGNILIATIVRELGPLLTSLIVIARSGTAVASELGNMQVNKEIESLRSVSIDPLGFIVFPRIMGGIISLVCLAFYFNIIALVGGFIVANMISELSFSFYIEVLSEALGLHDLTLNLLKNIVSGLIIFAIACDQGFQVKNGPHEVPIATTNAVVNAIIAVMTFNLTVTIITFVRGMA